MHPPEQIPEEQPSTAMPASAMDGIEFDVFADDNCPAVNCEMSVAARERKVIFERSSNASEEIAADVGCSFQPGLQGENQQVPTEEGCAAELLLDGSTVGACIRAAAAGASVGEPIKVQLHKDPPTSSILNAN
jgi:hypothetical protein